MDEIRPLTARQRAVYAAMKGGGTIRQHHTATSPWGVYTLHSASGASVRVQEATVLALVKRDLIQSEDVSRSFQTRSWFWRSDEQRPTEVTEAVHAAVASYGGVPR